MTPAAKLPGVTTGVIRGALGGGALKVVNALLALVTVGVMTRVMGASDFGVYAFALSLVTLLSIPAQLGLPTLIVRDAAAATGTASWAGLRGLLIRSNQFALLASLSLACLLVVLALWWPGVFGEARAPTVAVAACYLPIVTIGALRSATLRGLGHVVAAQVPDLLVRPLLFAGLIVAVAASQLALGPSLAIGLHIAAAAVGFVAGVAMLMRAMPLPLKRVRPVHAPPAWTQTLLPFMIIAAAPLLSAQIGIIAVAAFRPDADVGIYRAAALAGTSVMLPLHMVTNALDPAIARAFVGGAPGELAHLVRTAARATLAVMLPLTAICLIWNEAIMAALFGADFAAGGMLLAVMSLTPLGIALAGNAEPLLSMTGTERHATRILVVGMTGSMVLALLLTALFGPLGAAAAGVVASTAIAAAMNRVAVRRLSVSASPFVGTVR
jgi:O-antigen/teichoic acid export membrane protein